LEGITSICIFVFICNHGGGGGFTINKKVDNLGKIEKSLALIIVLLQILLEFRDFRFLPKNR
jgi:hypothetical protein